MLVVTKIESCKELAPAALVAVRCDCCKASQTAARVRHLPVVYGQRWQHDERGWSQEHGGPDVCPGCVAGKQ